MGIDFVHRYIRDAHRAYQACMDSLGVTGSRSDLFALLRAARRREIDRRGEVATPEGERYEYHIHGSGYSFEDMGCNKVIRFDVTTDNGNSYIRFSAWEVYKYASSIGESTSEETVASELGRISVGESSMVHVLEGQTDYYYCTEEVVSCNRGQMQ